jgi:hypothetical protein
VIGMPELDLFSSLAEIAGVFVGFGALIAIRSGDTMEVSDVNNIRWVMTTGIWVVITALAPTIIASYGLTGHELWLVCSLLALALLAIMILVFGRSPENVAEAKAEFATTPRLVLALSAGPTFWLPMVSLVLALVLVVLGLFPDHERALYLTAVALGLYMGAVGLFYAVFWRRRALSARGGHAATRSSAGGDQHA